MTTLSPRELAQIKMCIELFHPNPYIDHAIAQQVNLDRAIFLNGTLWDLGREITISFFPIDPQYNPRWYPISLVQSLLEPNETLDPIEGEARDQVTYPDAVKLVLTKRVFPLASGLKFRFVDSDGDIRIRFNNMGGSSSYVGIQSLNISPQDYTTTFGWMDVGTIIHEFCHALGMVHEHQNPRGNPIHWNVQAVYDWAAQTQGWDQQTTYQNIIMRYSTDQVNGSVYDPYSIMVYAVDPKLTTDGYSVHSNVQVSRTDCQWLTAMYPSQGIRQNPKPDVVSDMCKPYPAPEGSEGGSGGNSGTGGSPSDTTPTMDNKYNWVVYVSIAILVIIAIILVIVLIRL